MQRRTGFVAIALLTAIVALPAAAQDQQPDPNSPRYKGVVALSEFVASTGDEAIEAFIGTRMATSVRSSMSDEDLVAALTALRAEAAGASMRGARPIGPLAAEIVMVTADGTELSLEFELDAADNDRFVLIRSPGRTIGG